MITSMEIAVSTPVAKVKGLKVGIVTDKLDCVLMDVWTMILMESG